MSVSKDEMRKRKENLSPDRRALLDKLLRGTSSEESRFQSIPKRPEDVSIPLSFDQQRIWALEQKEPGSVVCNVFRAFSIKGPLDTGAFEKSINEIIRRHEILRTTFNVVDGKPVQWITPRLVVAVPVMDLRDLSEGERQDRFKRMRDEENHRSFDLKRGPLIRATLLRLDVDDHVLLLNIHHIVTDCWSLGVFFHELAALYASFSKGIPTSIPELPRQYGDFAHWQHRRVHEKVFAEQLTYWRGQLEGDLPLLRLPYDRPLVQRGACRRKTRFLRLSEELSGSLKALSRHCGVTLFMTLLAAFQWFLHRQTGQDDIIVFTPIAIRNRPETERVIGFFTNILAMRTDMKGISSFPDLLDRVHKVVLSAYDNQDIPFEIIIEEMRSERFISHRSLTQVMIQLRVLPQAPLDLPGLTIGDLGFDEKGNISPLEIINKTEAFDLTVDFGEEGEGLWCLIEYNADLFDAGTITRMMGEFQVLLEEVGGDLDPGRKDRLPEKSFVAPVDEIEIQLTAVWKKVLGVSPIGTRDNFFELGGNSLMAMQMFGQFETIFRKCLPVSALFQAPTVEELAKVVREELSLAEGLPADAPYRAPPGDAHPP
jgi:aspartate racemase